jgi:hypothetical protein
VRVGADRGGGGRAEQRHLQPPVFLQLEAVALGQRLADGEADLFAAIIDAAPHGGRSVAREIGRERRARGFEIRTAQQQRHDRDPRDENQERHGPRDGARQRFDKRAHVSTQVIGRLNGRLHLAA